MAGAASSAKGGCVHQHLHESGQKTNIYMSSRRDKLSAAVGQAMAGAASAAKGGFVRDALVGSFPRLALVLEEALAKVQRDTNVRSCCELLVDRVARSEALP